MSKLLLCLVLLAIPAWAVDRTRVLGAIAMVETGSTGVKMGAAGEYTRYQILPATWVRFSTKSMRWATQAEVDRVAHLLLEEIMQSLKSRRMAVTPYNIALAWNGGVGSLGTRPPTRRSDYAERVNNIYEYLESQ
jgi:hypothetical protein